jgi:hypothetical protein
MVGAHGLFADLVDPLGFDVIGVFALVVLKISAPNSTPGIGGAPDERRSQGALGLIYLCADDLVDETLIVFQGFGRPGDLDIHGSAGGHGLEVLGAHDASHPGAAS